ncbi:hypothetical protein HMPREF0185_01455 [Brevundimonas diminuta 470-4]|nr:hypothetical protein HMPREF0185_01455 [Brevundimonas diminuta 470-4]
MAGDRQLHDDKNPRTRLVRGDAYRPNATVRRGFCETPARNRPLTTEAADVRPRRALP